jgi:hypothetical protein
MAPFPAPLMTNTGEISTDNTERRKNKREGKEVTIIASVTEEGG